MQHEKPCARMCCGIRVVPYLLGAHHRFAVVVAAMNGLEVIGIAIAIGGVAGLIWAVLAERFRL